VSAGRLLTGSSFPASVRSKQRLRLSDVSEVRLLTASIPASVKTPDQSLLFHLNSSYTTAGNHSTSMPDIYNQLTTQARVSRAAHNPCLLLHGHARA
jgi:hypothetical protein